MTQDIKKLAEQVKKILQDEALNAKKEQEIQKLDDQIEHITNDSTLKDVEREMHLSALNFKKKRMDLIYADLDKAKAFAEKEAAFNKEQELNMIRINPQGNTVIELYVPKDSLDNFDELLVASKKYWDTLSDMLDE